MLSSARAFAPLRAGLDSLSAVELRNHLQRQLGVALPGTLIFDYPTLASLVAFLQQELAAADSGAAASGGAGLAGPTAPLASPSQQQEGQQRLVAIDASAARLPVPSISSSTDTCHPTPYSRWDVDSSVSGVSQRPGGRFARFLGGVEAFDAAAFATTSSEALLIDPQQRLMLEVREADTPAGCCWPVCTPLCRCGCGVGPPRPHRSKLCAHLAAGRLGSAHHLRQHPFRRRRRRGGGPELLGLRAADGQGAAGGARGAPSDPIMPECHARIARLGDGKSRCTALSHNPGPAHYICVHNTSCAMRRMPCCGAGNVVSQVLHTFP